MTETIEIETQIRAVYQKPGKKRTFLQRVQTALTGVHYLADQEQSLFPLLLSLLQSASLRHDTEHRLHTILTEGTIAGGSLRIVSANELELTWLGKDETPTEYRALLRTRLNNGRVWLVVTGSDFLVRRIVVSILMRSIGVRYWRISGEES